MNTLNTIKRVGNSLAIASVLLLAAPDASAGIFYGNGFKGAGGMNGTIARAAGTIGSNSKSVHAATGYYHGVHRGSGNNLNSKKAPEDKPASTYTSPTYSPGFKLVYNQPKYLAKMKELQGEISQMEKSAHKDPKKMVQLIEAKRDFLFNWGKVLEADGVRIGWAAKKAKNGNRTEQWRGKKVTRERKDLHRVAELLFHKVDEVRTVRVWKDYAYGFRKISVKDLSKTMLTMIEKQYKQAIAYVSAKDVNRPARDLVALLGESIAPVADGIGGTTTWPYTLEKATKGLRVMSSKESAAAIGTLLGTLK